MKEKYIFVVGFSSQDIDDWILRAYLPHPLPAPAWATADAWDPPNPPKPPKPPAELWAAALAPAPPKNWGLAIAAKTTNYLFRQQKSTLVLHVNKNTKNYLPKAMQTATKMMSLANIFDVVVFLLWWWYN